MTPPHERFSAQPDTSLFTKLGLSGYSFSEIVAELVDNCIDARIDGKTLHVSVQIEDNYVEIKDDASGMTRSVLKSALVLAKSEKQGQLGRYGMGAKAACVSLGRKFTWDTASEKEDQAYRVEWDEAKWELQGTWEYDLEAFPKGKGAHGTRIRIENLRMKTGNKIAGARADLARRFGPFILKGVLELTVNDKPCTPTEPKLLAKEGLKVENPFRFDVALGKGKRIHGWVGLLAVSSQKGLYGFNTFLNGRMITAYDVIGFKRHATTARVVGEIHMDHVPVSNNKRQWITTDPLYEEAVAKVEEIIKPHVAEARRLAATHTVNISVETARTEQFKEAMARAAQAEELRDYTQPERNKGGLNTPTPDPKGDTEVTVPGREVRHEGDSKGTNPPTGTGGQRNPKKVDLQRNRRLKVKGKSFDYTHKWVALGDTGPWMEKEWNPETRMLEILSNEAHPSVLATKDVTFLSFMHIVDSVAQVFMEEAGADWDKYDEIRNILIREASRHMAQLKDDAGTE